MSKEDVLKKAGLLLLPRYSPLAMTQMPFLCCFPYSMLFYDLLRFVAQRSSRDRDSEPSRSRSASPSRTDRTSEMQQQLDVNIKKEPAERGSATSTAKVQPSGYDKNAISLLFSVLYVIL